MRAKVATALSKCCKRNVRSSLERVVLKDGYLNATDERVLVRVSNPETRKRAEGKVRYLSMVPVGLCRPSDDFPLGDCLVDEPMPTPDYGRMFGMAKGQRVEGSFTFDPKLVRKAVDVFAAADIDFRVEDRGGLLFMSGSNPALKLDIDAVVAGKRP